MFCHYEKVNVRKRHKKYRFSNVFVKFINIMKIICVPFSCILIHENHEPIVLYENHINGKYKYITSCNASELGDICIQKI